VRLSPAIYDRVMQLLPKLYVCRTVPDFLDQTVRLLKPLVVCDGCGWFIYAFGKEPKLVTFSESDPCLSPDIISKLGLIAQSHPFVQRWAVIGKPVPLMLSDCPQRVFGRFYDEYRDFFVCTGKNNLTVPVAVSEAGASALTFRSYSRPFTEEDRLIATLLRPHLQQAFANAEVFSKATESLTAFRMPGVGDELTERESEVAFWIGQGKTNWEIAAILGTAPRTIEKHVENVLKKLRVENRTTAAVQLARAVAGSGPSVRPTDGQKT
jgi:DNA-binding CsgD family transcriptional regulator